jgi:DNA-binding transcriptional LysR family regulator
LHNLVPLILFPEGCAYRRHAIAALQGQERKWQVSFVSPSFECLRAAAIEGMGVTVLARALVTPPLRILGLGRKLPPLPSVELAWARRKRSNSRLVSELAGYLSDSLVDSTGRQPVRGRPG